MSKIFSVFIEIIILCYYVLILLMFYLIYLPFHDLTESASQRSRQPQADSLDKS